MYDEGIGVDIRHEHLAPWISFSVDALLHVQLRAGSWPQEHLAWVAQGQDPSWVDLQQVGDGWIILKRGFLVFLFSKDI